MSSGYVCIAQNSNGVDYLRMAYLQALSVRISFAENFSVIVDKETFSQVEQKHIDVFDKIIVLRDDLAANSKIKMANECQVFRYSPYKTFVKTEADMLFNSNCTNLATYAYMDKQAFTSSVITYYGDVITDRSQRKLFDESLLPNVYSAFSCFEYDLEVKEFFDTMRIIIDDWSWYRDNYLVNCRYDEPRTDEVYALALKILDIDYKNKGLTFVHMKPRLQNLQLNLPWTEQVDLELDEKLNFTIGYYKQNKPLHYVEKTFVTDEILDRYEYEFNRKRDKGLVG